MFLDKLGFENLTPRIILLYFVVLWYSYHTPCTHVYTQQNLILEFHQGMDEIDAQNMF
jgi:hypothetical protein